MPVNNPSGGGSDYLEQRVEEHADLETPVRHNEALTCEVSATTAEEFTFDFENELDPGFSFDGDWDVHWDDEYFFLENASASADYDLNFTVVVPDSASEVRFTLDAGSVNGGTHYRAIEALIDGLSVYSESGFADVSPIWAIALETGTHIVTLRYNSANAGSVGVEEAYVNGPTLRYVIPAEGATSEWKTRGFAKEIHKHYWNDLIEPPGWISAPSTTDEHVLKIVGGVPTWAAP